jgi:uncharacterized damage-inducible protein DinB
MEMHPLATAALAQFDEIHDDLRRVVGDLQAEALNWRPGEETNSIYVLVTHLLGAEHFWLAAAAGRPVARDREAEFRAQGRDPTGLLRLLEEADARNRDLLAHLTPETLAATFTGRDETRSGAWCLLHAIEHSGQHRGQAALTRQLWEFAQRR